MTMQQVSPVQSSELAQPTDWGKCKKWVYATAEKVSSQQTTIRYTTQSTAGGSEIEFVHDEHGKQGSEFMTPTSVR